MVNNKSEYKICELSFWQMFLLISYNLRMITIIFEVMSLLGLLFVFSTLINVVLVFHVIYWQGIVLPFCIHEYIHMMMMKRCGVDNIEIYSDFFKISLIPKVHMKDKDLFLVSMSGPMSCFCISLLLLSICELIFNNSIVKVISFIYMLHVFNLCPCFGDGKIVVKIIVKYLKCFIDNKK